MITDLRLKEYEGGASTYYDADSLMICSVCFDVEDEDGEVEEGTEGVGVCAYFTPDNWYNDAEFYGTVEALGSDSFSFKEARKNDWDRDQSGYWGLYSASYWPYEDEYITYFVSTPLNVNSNSRKNLGISKGESYWQCFVGEHEVPSWDDVASEFEISLEKFSTDIPRWIDTSAIEDNAWMLYSVMSMLLLLGIA